MTALNKYFNWLILVINSLRARLGLGIWLAGRIEMIFVLKVKAERVDFRDGNGI